MTTAIKPTQEVPGEASTHPRDVPPGVNGAAAEVAAGAVPNAVAPPQSKDETQEVRVVAGRIIQQRAKRRGQMARVALDGPTGAGKTWTALVLATELDTEQKGILLIDTERGSASKYADDFVFATVDWTPPYDPMELGRLIASEAVNYGVVIVDSLTHFWKGEGGTLNQVDAAKSRFGGNEYAGWKVGTPVQDFMVEQILAARCHVIGTMRSKMEYLQQKNERTGKTTIERVGLAPEQRTGVEYEFDVIGSMDLGHQLTITKTRCAPLADKVYAKGRADECGKLLSTWLQGAANEDTPRPVLAYPEALAAIFDALKAMPASDRATLIKTRGYNADPKVAPLIPVQDWLATFDHDGLQQMADAVRLHIRVEGGDAGPVRVAEDDVPGPAEAALFGANGHQEPEATATPEAAGASSGSPVEDPFG